MPKISVQPQASPHIHNLLACRGHGHSRVRAQAHVGLRSFSPPTTTRHTHRLRCPPA